MSECAQTLYGANGRSSIPAGSPALVRARVGVATLSSLQTISCVRASSASACKHVESDEQWRALDATEVQICLYLSLD